mmetsp:Transcript_2276/g.4900  ORF Transcript_2276/g.4900 Transcript_2276/m.4900 type:complete len:82 (-) Transcript_2276:402-647(-)
MMQIGDSIAHSAAILDILAALAILAGEAVDGDDAAQQQQVVSVATNDGPARLVLFFILRWKAHGVPSSKSTPILCCGAILQ